MSEGKEKSLQFDFRSNYLERIRASVGSEMFKHCFCKDSRGRLVDVCRGGMLSCAVFVSNILKMYDLIQIPTANCGTLEKRLMMCGWFCHGYEENFLYPGSIIFWEPRRSSDGEMHRHVGFYYDLGVAISNDPRSVEEGSTRAPIMHRINCADLLDVSRDIEKIYVHPFLKTC